MSNPKFVILFLRLGIASVFLYAAIASTLDPINWSGYLPPFVTIIAPMNVVLICFSLFEFILSIWILSGWKSLYAAFLAATTLLAIIGANWSDRDILFRDFAIFFAALALAAASVGKKK